MKTLTIINILLLLTAMSGMAATIQSVTFASSSSTQAPNLIVDLNVLESSDFVPQSTQQTNTTMRHITLSRISVAEQPSQKKPAPKLRTIADCEKFLAVDPQSIPAWTTYGRMLLLLGDIEASVQAFTKAYQIDTNSLTTLSNYAAILVPAGRYDEALLLLQQASLRYPARPRFRFNLACLHVAMGNYDLAMQELRILAEIPWLKLSLHLGDPDLDPLREREDFTQLLIWAKTIE